MEFLRSRLARRKTKRSRKNAEEYREKTVKRREKMDRMHELIKINRQNRKEIQKISHDMNPKLGRAVHTYHKLLDTLDNYIESSNNGLNRMLLADDVVDLSPGDHLYVQRPGFTHHGLYMKESLILHYHMGLVKITGWEEFSEGSPIHKKAEEDSPSSYLGEEIIKRALSRYGENQY